MSDGAPDGKVPGLSPEPPKNGEAKKPPSAALATLKTLAFIAVIQVFALAITKVNEPITEIVAPQGIPTPGGNSASGGVYNVLILVVFVFATTLTAVWLARRRRVKLFMAMIFGGTAIALFLLTLLASISLTGSYMDANSSLYLSLALATSTVVLLSLIALRKVPASFALILTGLLSAEVGSYFASAIPILTAILLPLGFALYDIYTVFRGPLKTLINTLPDESFSTMASKVGDFSIGTGDTVFYAMVPALGYYQFYSKFGLGSAFLPILAVDAGVVVTLYLLSKAKLLPGLPIPMGLGVAVLLVFYFR
ncbi:MAG TPA: hypothetical protein VGS04_06000 [Nitrososphaerales archaeon]|nr:hypothetical protein [Nitrososphaerales archaeon]